ncbi:MAG: serine/threonine-protein kinase [Acidobacteriota bacterium]
MALSPMNLVGTQIGNIRLENLLGVGGMGEVYQGFDEKLERRVAVKTIRAEHRLSDEMKARFLREARILSKLEDSAITQVYDLIEGDDTDFLIFEFVEGQTLRQAATRRRLGEIEIMELGERISRALAVAHEARVVHRDLKPDNIMVQPSGAVKILDFGIARASADPFEHAETRRLDTMAMPAPIIDDAPTLLDNAPVDDHATIFDDERPTELAPTDLGDDEPTRTLPLIGRDDQAITKVMGDEAAATVPSMAVATSSMTSSTWDSALTEQGHVLGTVRYMSPEQARGEDVTPKSDLYAFGIMMQELLTHRPAYDDVSSPHKLLLKVARNETVPITDVDPDLARLIEDLKQLNPDRRPSAAKTAEQLRWVLDKPQRLRRKRLRAMAAAAAFVVLIGVLIVVSVLAVRAENARRDAEAARQIAVEEADRANREAERANVEATTAQQVSDFLVNLFEEADPEATRISNVTAADLVDRGTEQLPDLEDQPVVQARIAETLGVIYWKLSNFDRAEGLFDNALTVLRDELGDASAESARTLDRLAALYSDTGRYDEAETMHRDAITALEAALGPDDSKLADGYNGLGILFMRQGRFDDAAPEFEKALAIRERAFGSEHPEVGATLNNLAILAWQTGDLELARERYERAIGIAETVLGADSPDLARQLNNLGILYRQIGAYDESDAAHTRARRIAEAAFGEMHADVAAILNSHGRLYVARERDTDALPLFQRALAINRETVGNAHPEVGRGLVQIAGIEIRRERLDPARRALERATDNLTGALGDVHPYTLEALRALANVYRDLGQFSDAEPLYRRAMTSATRIYGPEHPEVTGIQDDLTRLIELRAGAAAS